MLTLIEIYQRMENLHDWAVDGSSIVRDIEFENEQTAEEFEAWVISHYKDLPEKPALLMNGKLIRVSFIGEGGLSEKEIDSASEFDTLKEEYDVRRENKEEDENESDLSDEIESMETIENEEVEIKEESSESEVESEESEGSESEE